MTKNYIFIYIVFLLCLNLYSQNDTVISSGINLKEIQISGNGENSAASEVITSIDKQLRPTNSAQDLLRLVPGLFIAQHAGGGKAEQIFLRGFDCDHGTDFSLNIDGMPVNMVSHAHGQGYADFHFVIPETVNKLQVYKGPYNTAYGDFATSGAAEFSTKNTIGKSQVKLEYGQFDTYRALAMIDLLQNKHLFTKNNENFYVAGEYFFSNSYFDRKQNFSRYNLFSKYSAQINDNNYFTLSGSTFSSDWNASGQVPERAVRDGAISRFGSIDPSEGGTTGRTNVNAKLVTTFKNGGILKNQAYYSHYRFNLYSNFTFFLNDSINGDEISQTEKGRNIYGYKVTYEKTSFVGNKNLKTVVGIGTRIDEGGIDLKHAVKRITIDTFSVGRLYQQNASAYLDETLALTSKLSLNAGVRFDYFDYKFTNLQYDSLSGPRQVPKVSPKINLYYDIAQSVQLYAHSGLGFHSNDARSVVLNKTEHSLPTAFGYETGSIFKLGSNIVINAALWGLELQNELVYVGDEAVVEISGATRRLGADLALRWQLTEHLFLDGDLNFSHGRFVNVPDNESRIPLAPSLTSTGGISYKRQKGFNASLRYRYIDSRPANEANTVTALGYFLLDAVINYTRPKFQIGMSVENILNSEWNQAQFDTQSRLKGETQSVSELHYTPGTPFFIKGSITFFF